MTVRISLCILTALGVLLLAVRCGPDSPEIDFDHVAGATIDYFITPQRADDLAPIGNVFDVTPTGSVLIGTRGQLALLTENQGNVTIDKLGTATPDSFALDPGGALLTVVGQYFGQLQEEGLTNALPLPTRGMRLAPSNTAGKVLLFGGPGETENRLYAVNDDGTMDFLVELPQPIIAASDSNTGLYVATRKAIYRAGMSHVGNKFDFELVIGLNDDVGAIQSLSAAPDDNVAFFATSDRVYALRGLSALAIVRNAGGLIRYRSNSVYLLDSQRKLLIRISIPGITDQ